MTRRKLAENPSPAILIGSKDFLWLFVVEIEIRENARDGAGCTFDLE
jgi:hypothetical protein